MAGWGALSAALAGAATGIAERNKARRDRADQQAQEAERKREFDVTAQQQHDYYDRLNKTAEANAAKTTADTSAANTQDASNKAFRSKLQLPNGWATMPDGDKISYLQKRQTAALQVGDMETAKSTQDAINGISLGAQREANAQYTGGARTDLTNAQTGLTGARTTTEGARQDLLHAQAAAARDLPARARQIAAGHDAASLQRATLQANNRTELAHYNGNVRAGLAQLTAAYHLTGMEYGAATRAAIDQYNQSEQNYRQQMTPAAQLTRDPNAAAPMQPTFVMPQAPSTPLTINLGGNGSLVGPNGELTPAMQAQLRALMRRDGGGAPGNAPRPGTGGGASNAAPPAALVQLVTSALKNGHSPAEVRAAAIQSGSSPQDVDRALAAARGSAAPRRTLPPLPVRNKPAIQGISPELLPAQ